MAVDTSKIILEGVWRIPDIHDMTLEQRLRANFWYGQEETDRIIPTTVILWSYGDIPSSTMLFDKKDYTNVSDIDLFNDHIEQMVDIIEFEQEHRNKSDGS